MTTGSCRGCAGRELDAFIILGKVCAPAVLAPKALRASKEFAVLVTVVHLRSWEGGPDVVQKASGGTSTSRGGPVRYALRMAALALDGCTRVALTSR